MKEGIYKFSGKLSEGYGEVYFSAKNNNGLGCFNVLKRINNKCYEEIEDIPFLNFEENLNDIPLFSFFKEGYNFQDLIRVGGLECIVKNGK